MIGKDGTNLKIKKILNTTSSTSLKTSNITQRIRQSQVFPLKKFFNLEIVGNPTAPEIPHPWDPHIQPESSDDEDDEPITLNPDPDPTQKYTPAPEHPEIFNIDPDLIQDPDNQAEDYHYHLQRQIWESQLMLARLSQSNDDSEPYSAYKSFETVNSPLLAQNMLTVNKYQMNMIILKDQVNIELFPPANQKPERNKKLMSCIISLKLMVQHQLMPPIHQP